VYRLVTDKPERLSMRVLIALCDILDCTPADLIDPYAESARRKTAGESAAVVAELKPDPRLWDWSRWLRDRAVVTW
jgi:hypothetical protein